MRRESRPLPAEGRQCRQSKRFFASVPGSLSLLLQLLKFVWRHCVCRRPLAHLKCANVGDDRPPVACVDLVCIWRHGAETVGDDVEELTWWRCAEFVRVKGCRWPAKTTARDHAITKTDVAVAWTAVDVETLLASMEHVHRYRKWKPIGEPCR